MCIFENFKVFQTFMRACVRRVTICSSIVCASHQTHTRVEWRRSSKRNEPRQRQLARG